MKNDITHKNVIKGLGEDIFDSEGRFLHVEFDDFVLNNSYYPNGQRDHGRVPYKLNFSRAVQKYYLEHEKPSLLCGDFNTAHTEIDLANPKTNKNTTGFLPIERAWVDELLDSGFVDLYRDQHGPIEGRYTWWTYRSNCREKNIGWRLDYFFANRGLENKVKSIEHQDQVLGSDHCPVLLEI